MCMAELSHLISQRRGHFGQTNHLLDRLVVRKLQSALCGICAKSGASHCSEWCDRGLLMLH
jgi:hypothetical protein